MSTIEYQCLEGLPDADILAEIVAINQTIFGFNETEENLHQCFSEHQKLLICMAYQDGRLVGFKVGFEREPRSFESWRGGVLESARRQGIAAELMRLQHDWCQAHNFRVIQTTTNSDNIGMLMVNLQSGFEIIGSFVNRNKRLKLLQEKYL